MKNFYINQSTCSHCFICSEICPASVIVKKENVVDFDPQNIEICVECGQCMAVCRTKSIFVANYNYDNDFFEFSEEKNFVSLIEHRRSIRRFKPKPVEQELLEKILKAITFSPHGDKNQSVEITIINNREKIYEALPLMSEFYDKLDKWLDNPFIKFMIRREIGVEGINTLLHHLRPRIKRGLYKNISFEYDTITRGAHTLIIFHADKKSPEHTNDAYIYATTAMYAALDLGLGSTIIGLVPPPINKIKEIKRMFKIPEQNEAVVSLIVGYPKYKYLRGIKRKLKNIDWI